MCQLELFDGDFALVQPSTNFRFIGTFQPQLHRFFDHFFSVFWCLALTDDPEFGTIRHIPAVFTPAQLQQSALEVSSEQSILCDRFG